MMLCGHGPAAARVWKSRSYCWFSVPFSGIPREPRARYDRCYMWGRTRNRELGTSSKRRIPLLSSAERSCVAKSWAIGSIHAGTDRIHDFKVGPRCWESKNIVTNVTRTAEGSLRRITIDHVYYAVHFAYLMLMIKAPWLCSQRRRNLKARCSADT